MPKHDFKFEQGVKAKHKLSGFKGTVTARANYVTGCDQYLLNPGTLDEKGDPNKSHWFDEGIIGLIPDKKKIEPESVQGTKKGGPQPDQPPVK